MIGNRFWLNLTWMATYCEEEVMSVISRFCIPRFLAKHLNYLITNTLIIFSIADGFPDGLYRGASRAAVIPSL